jgi:hypothetical protein
MEKVKYSTDLGRRVGVRLAHPTPFGEFQTDAG